MLRKAAKKTRRPRISGIFSAPNHLSNKIVLSPKIFTNTYRMELNLDLFHYIPPYSKKGGHSETLLNACIAHSNSADLLLSKRF